MSGEVQLKVSSGDENVTEPVDCKSQNAKIFVEILVHIYTGTTPLNTPISYTGVVPAIPLILIGLINRLIFEISVLLLNNETWAPVSKIIW